ncbi:MBL fold metallo-hydrolase [Candidatus Neomarinimicrobiota bacterium]
MKSWITKSGISIHRVLRGRCNCYLASKENRFLLIDTGRERSWKNLKRGLTRLGVKEGSHISLILTHCHFDHAENAARFKETYKASVIVQKSEGDCLKSGDNPDTGGTLFLTKVLIGILYRAKLDSRFRYQPADFDVSVDKKYRLEPFGFPGYILHTPGHSQGSISVIIDNEIAIVGDTIFGVMRGSVFPPFASDVRLMVKSWKQLLDTGCEIYLPGHGSERSKHLLKRGYDTYKQRYEL